MCIRDRSYTICYLKRSWRNTFVEKRNAVNKRVYRFNFTVTEEHVAKAPKPAATLTTSAAVSTVSPMNADDHKKDAKVSAQSAYSAAAAALSNFAALEQSQQAGEAKSEKQFDIEEV